MADPAIMRIIAIPVPLVLMGLLLGVQTEMWDRDSFGCGFAGLDAGNLV